MERGEVRILLLADTHLGFDLPVSPRVRRRRRGHDFLANYATALQPALAGEADVVVHAGDVFNRSRVVPALAWQAFEPLRRVADGGVPVFIVPGNHERSALPHLRFASHPRIHIFDRPRTFVTAVRGITVAMAGFPFERRDVRTRFPVLLGETGWQEAVADVRMLCLHQCVEGATVGPAGYTFTRAPDVVRLRDVPGGISAVLAGHIHRHQVLTTDLATRPLSAPVLYPGSIERTSVAELAEAKGYMLVRVGPGDGRPLVGWEFRELPARPMIRKDLVADALGDEGFDLALREAIRSAPPDAVLAIRVTGTVSDIQCKALAAGRLRAIAPHTMNVDVSLADRFRGQGSASHAAGPHSTL